jgi:hypothetical protein
LFPLQLLSSSQEAYVFCKKTCHCHQCCSLSKSRSRVISVDSLITALITLLIIQGALMNGNDVAGTRNYAALFCCQTRFVPDTFSPVEWGVNFDWFNWHVFKNTLSFTLDERLMFFECMYVCTTFNTRHSTYVGLEGYDIPKDRIGMHVWICKSIKSLTS